MQCARGGADRSSRVDGVEDFNLAESHGIDLKVPSGSCQIAICYSGLRPTPSRRGSAAHSSVPSRRNTPCRPESSPEPERTSLPRRVSSARMRGEKREASPLKRLPRATRLGRSTACCSGRRSEEHTSELQSLMRKSYAVSCLKKQT